MCEALLLGGGVGVVGGPRRAKTGTLSRKDLVHCVVENSRFGHSPNKKVVLD